MKTNNNKSGYSVIIALLMVGFMLVLTVGVFNLIVSQSKDTKAMEYYLKAYAGAEGSLELAMLNAKENNYSIDYEIKKGSSESKMLAKNLEISYTLSGTTNKIIDKILSPNDFAIIPLFTLDKKGIENKAKTNVKLEGLNGNVIWNIVGGTGGISGTNDFSGDTLGNLKTIKSNGDINYETKSVGAFLNSSDKNYLILNNLGNNNINFSLKADENFTKDNTFIIATGEIGGYKQNIRLTINSSEFLNLLKYSIFSN